MSTIEIDTRRVIEAPIAPAKEYRREQHWVNEAYLDEAVRDAVLVERARIAAYINDLAAGQGLLVQLFASAVLGAVQEG